MHIPRIPYKLLLFLILLACIIPTASADMSRTFTPNQSIVINMTYEYYTTNATPDWVWLETIAIGLVLVFFSFILKPEESNASADALVVFAGIGSLFLLAGVIQSLTIDTITTSGMIGLTNTAINNATQIALIEKHTLYTNVNTIPLLITWFVSLLNLYRVYLLRNSILANSE